jgi:molybdopterin synthase catalytic subunit
MRVTLLTFGILRDLLGDFEGAVELPSGSTVRDLLDHCHIQASEGPAAIWSALAVAVNREYVPASHSLRDGDEVALLPPVSGGTADDGDPPRPMIALTSDPIDSAALVASLKRGQDGALVVFDGIVRNHTRDRLTLYLFYEAYPEMALSQMRSLAVDAATRYAIRDLCIVHRLGRLEIGETSVLIAVASAHRAAAFDACRWLIDTLKQTVPIWKKEFFEDGAVWAQGDPFPAHIHPQSTPDKADPERAG